MDSRTIVVGAGLAGLACAHELARAGDDVLVLERGAQAGGVVDTLERGRFRFESGPNTVLASATEFRALCVELGLDERLVASKPTARTRWLFHRGRLRPLPTSPLQLVTSDLLSTRGKLDLLSEPFRSYAAPLDREPTLEEFLVDRLGPEAARRLGGAFVRGVYAAELGELGAASAFPKLFALASEQGSLVRGAVLRSRRRSAPQAGRTLPRGAMVTFPLGLRELPSALAERLGTRLRTHHAVEAIERFGDGWLVRGELSPLDARPRSTAPTFAFPCSRVVVATPARATATLLRDVLHAAERDFVLDVRHAAVTVVHQGFGAEILPEGFGFLVPPDAPREEAPLALGTIFASNVFDDRAPAGHAATASFYRGADVSMLDDRALLERARADLALALGREVPRASAHAILRWHDVIPRHAPGHAARIAKLRSDLRLRAPSLELCGGWLDRVSIDDVIRSGRAAARRLGARATNEAFPT